MRETSTNTVKPLIVNVLIRGHLLALAERLSSSSYEHAAHVCEALEIVLAAKEGVEL